MNIMDKQLEQRIFTLTVQDLAVGAAILPVGVLGIKGNDSVVSWMPGADTADWAKKVAYLEAATDKLAVVRDWDERSNGIAWAIQEVSTEDGTDLRVAVEATLDTLMATPG
jgi:hypothetical protein